MLNCWMKDCLILTLKDGKNFGGNTEEGEMCTNVSKGLTWRKQAEEFWDIKLKTIKHIRLK